MLVVGWLGILLGSPEEVGLGERRCGAVAGERSWEIGRASCRERVSFTV